MRRYLFFGVLVFFILGSVGFVSADFSVSSRYSDNFPLRLNPGGFEETFFILKNFALDGSEGGGIFVDAELSEGGDVAGFLDSELSYSIPYGGNVRVPIRIEVPGDAKVGKEYIVRAVFRSSSEREGENVQFSVNLDKSFPVLVVAEDESFGGSPPSIKGASVIFWMIFMVLAVLILGVGVLIVYFVRRRRTFGQYIEGV